MSRMIAMVGVFAISSFTYADLPPAPLNASVAQEILNEFNDCCYDDYMDELARVPRMPVVPGTEESFLYAKYMNEAFEEAGYSLDKTLLSYYNSQRNFPVVAFMSRLNLEIFAANLRSDTVGKAFLKAEAVSKSTVSYAKDIAKDVPVSNADYIFEGNPAYSIEFPTNVRIAREKARDIGYVRRGNGVWENWLYLETGDGSSVVQSGVGLVADADTDVGSEERALWESLIGRRVKAEGVQIFVTEPGIGVHVPMRFFDKKYPILIKSL
ncbi:hypothetical protein ACRS5L_22395 [Metapseudomonas otitidis]|uniref:hypothetical protein n=1 Tax=Metapseudomonas otitidis TaxID=319939 RepID=UPI003EDF0C52